MTGLKRKAIVSEVVLSKWGQPCPCCQEIHEFENRELGGDFLASVQAFQKIMGTGKIGTQAVTAFRLVPVPQGVAKRGRDFFYLAPNVKAAHDEECRQTYQTMWLRHPDRLAFIDEMVLEEKRSLIKLKRRKK